MHRILTNDHLGHSRKVLKTFFTYLWTKQSSFYRKRVLLALLCLLLGKIVALFIPVLFKHAIDSLSHHKAITWTWLPLAWVISYGIARVTADLLAEFKTLLATRVQQRTMRTAALEVFTHLYRLGMRFHLNRQTGGLTRYLERGVKGVETFIRLALFSLFPILIEVTLISIVMWYIYDLTLSLITLTTLMTYIVFSIWMTEKRTVHIRAMNQLDSDAINKAVDGLINFETVKYFGNEAWEKDRYDISLQAYEKAATRSYRFLSYLNMGQSLIITLGLNIIMILVANQVMKHTLTVGDFVMVNAYLLQVYSPLNFLGVAYRDIKQSLVDMEQMFAFFQEPIEIQDKPQAVPLKITKGEICFEKVSFSYQPDRSILHDISFTVPAGQTIAIVGASGSGKSTLARLLFRFYDVTSGRITIDGQDIREVSQQSLHHSIGMVPQDTVPFNNTIEYNIRYGRTTATTEEVIEAAKAANIQDFIVSLPQGYQTVVGERGLKLSGGEKQRLAIARTLLKNPPILFFDEATSSLDTHTERAIQESLHLWSEHRTTLVIAHRLSTIVHVDQILVMEKGYIIERGTHETLLSLNKKYAALWRKQYR